MNHGSLFSGIGGFDLAAQWMGWQNIFQVEIDKFCTKVLEKNFPNVKRYGDIKEFDGTKYRGAVDVISGGFPCQPFSVAGKRQGEKDDRFIWPEMLRVISEIKPPFVVGENVTGLITLENGKTLERIFTDLEDEGYTVESFIIPACGVGAWHRRDRIWIIAYTEHIRDSQKSERIQKKGKRKGMENRDKIHKFKQSDILRGFSSDSKKQRFPERDEKQIQNKTHTAIKRYNCIPYWENFPTQSPVCGRNDGISNRVERIKGLGNAIVPQVAYEIFKVIDEIFNS